ncbi:hypothetical protein J6590_104868 [Homalodisca vitripennis]|nr:hypothetical protein J6590_104868 [Homalodisca vitripennis]
MEYVRLPRVTVSDYLTNTNVRQLFASRANIVSERRWRRLLFEDASTLQFAKHSPPNTLNVRTNIHELFGQTCSTKKGLPNITAIATANSCKRLWTDDGCYQFKSTSSPKLITPRCWLLCFRPLPTGR